MSARLCPGNSVWLADSSRLCGFHRWLAGQGATSRDPPPPGRRTYLLLPEENRQNRTRGKKPARRTARRGPPPVWRDGPAPLRLRLVLPASAGPAAVRRSLRSPTDDPDAGAGAHGGVRGYGQVAPRGSSLCWLWLWTDHHFGWRLGGSGAPLRDTWEEQRACAGPLLTSPRPRAAPSRGPRSSSWRGLLTAKPELNADGHVLKILSQQFVSYSEIQRFESKCGSALTKLSWCSWTQSDSLTV